MRSTLELRSTPHRPPNVGWPALACTLVLGLAVVAVPYSFSQTGRMVLAGYRGAPPPSPGSQGYLGIGFRDVTNDRVGLLNLKEARGAEVIQVDHDGPAGIAGLTEHDVILQVNGQTIEGEEQLRRVLHETPVGRNVTLVYSRYGQQQTLTAQMADRAVLERQAWEQHLSVPEPSSGYRGGNSFISGGMTATPPPDPHGHSLIPSGILPSSYTGIVLEAIGPQLAQFFGSQEGTGLLVRSVDPNSPASAAGLRAGDVVVRANSVVVTGIGKWDKLVRENKGKPVSVVIMRDKQQETLILVPDSKKRSSLDHFRPWRESSPSDQARATAPASAMNFN